MKALSPLAGFEESAHGLEYPGEFRPQSATTLAALAGAWLAALASAPVVAAMGPIAGRAGFARDKPGRCAPIHWLVAG